METCDIRHIYCNVMYFPIVSGAVLLYPSFFYSLQSVFLFFHTVLHQEGLISNLVKLQNFEQCC